ncbi:hypothetical protein K7X08_004550 [Anisodus acutangulus]|uniref:Reticulon domain-containing protein n=1 Tax=Anisodus acutangulus TaxID=402998 RepID=A0A9Q1MHD8_9SOLA|nr:hypothetical protein K7X08_004550 [Anisodus acutangulus]
MEELNVNEETIASTRTINPRKKKDMNISVPVDPLEWQISQGTANRVLACLANTVGGAESVLRVSATGHDNRLFVKVVVTLYVLSVLGRIASGVTIAYAGLCVLCLYMLAVNSQLINTCLSKRTRDSTDTVQSD